MSLTMDERRARRRQRLLMNQDERLKKITGVKEKQEENYTTTNGEGVESQVQHTTESTDVLNTVKVSPREGLHSTNVTELIPDATDETQDDTGYVTSNAHHITHVDVHSTNIESDYRCMYNQTTTDDDLSHCISAGEMIMKKRHVNGALNEALQTRNRDTPRASPTIAALKHDLSTVLSSSSHQSEGNDVYNALFGKEREDVEPNSNEKNFLKVKYVVCMLVGVLIRLSFLFPLGIEYVQTIFYPFVTLEIALQGYLYAGNLEASVDKGGSVFLTLLMLSGLNPEIINKYKHCMRILTLVLEDFAYYFFAFLVTHVMCTLVGY